MNRTDKILLGILWACVVAWLWIVATPLQTLVFGIGGPLVVALCVHEWREWRIDRADNARIVRNIERSIRARQEHS